MTTAGTASPPALVLPDAPHLERLFADTWRWAEANLIQRPDLDGALGGTLMSCIPGMDTVWLWDSCFMALYARYAHRLLPAHATLDQYYRYQREDGFIAMAYQHTTGELRYGERINPPLLAWAEWGLYRVTGDRDRLARVLPALVRFFDWVKDHRRRSSGLYWFEDPGSTGMDNSPRGGYHSIDLNGSDLAHVDLVSQQALAAIVLARIARLVGEPAIADRFDTEHRELASLVQRYHWSPQAKFFLDVFIRTQPEDRHNLVNHLTVAGFWPLLGEVAEPHQIAALAEHLSDRQTFGTPHRVPTLSAGDPNFDPHGGYWLGGVWSPATYMVCEGLAVSGEAELAHVIATEHVEALARVAADPEYGGLWECYAPMHDRPATAKGTHLCRPNFVGWTGLSTTALVIEHVVGLACDAGSSEVVWTPRRPGVQGVRGTAFGDGTISVTGDWDADQDQYRLSVETSHPVTVVVRIGDREDRYPVAAGRHVLC